MRILAGMSDRDLNQAYWDAKWAIRSTKLGEDPDMQWVELLVETQMEAMERPRFKFEIAKWNMGPAYTRFHEQRKAEKKAKSDVVAD